ncbi:MULTISPECIES: FtsW/RodA/SpoVE family cell cycle protein [Paenibacillus]|uniref:Cell cycle protein n=1 Tax=Paenibacillus campinasensis TaxID=66347 RepID=A0A268EVU2_9BACL|nr:FtsW/RodA/SpoVE family cell cycle protein [Paenibacillus campinasensis]PAD77249.1 cell cycle protein [Paenibacillus campinasensis]
MLNYFWEKIKKIDYLIVFVLLILMVVSLTSIYSVTKDTKLDGSHISMIKFYIVGFIAFFGMSLVDFRLLIKYAWYIYGGGLITLVLVIFIGKDLNGAQGWIYIGTLSVQPAELFKLVLIIFLSFVLYHKRKKPHLKFWSDVVPIGMIAFLPFALVMVQNDLGNALSYFVILVGLLWIGNIKYTHALIGAVVLLGGAFGGTQAYIHFHDELVESKLLKSHWMARLDSWLLPEEAPSDTVYHTRNAKLAISSGGLSGAGYMEGGYVQRNFIPYAYSDSIFVQIAEEYGFIGSSVLLLLYFILIHRMILIALECKNRAGPYLIVGIIAMFIYQIFENIGMFIGLMPLTGITLPFISYGGTSLLINMASIGVAMSVKLHGQEVEEDMPDPHAVRPAATRTREA